MLDAPLPGIHRARAWVRGLNRETMSKAGYYAALAALLVILGCASHAYRARRTEAAQVPEPRVPVLAARSTAIPTPRPTPEPEIWQWPLEGEIIGEYAPDAPVWSRTLSQWQTHPALDIAALPGEAVCACADGTVVDAWQDALWGNVIVIGHEDGYESTYANLNTLNLVGVGDVGSRGEVISSVGSSAACEGSMPWHLHFALTKDGAPVDFAGLAEKAP